MNDEIIYTLVNLLINCDDKDLQSAIETLCMNPVNCFKFIDT